MVGTTTTATTTTATMSLSPSPEPSRESIDSPEAATQLFIPGQCLFCAKSSPSFEDSVVHMQKSHGLFVPQRQHLVVDLETLFRYLHLVIFGYRECIHCGTERATVQAVQQHMTGKGHCKFDISEQESEFAEFYDFSEPEDEEEGDLEEEEEEEEEDGSEGEKSPAQQAPNSTRKPLQADEDSIRLPSGKIISKQSSAQTAPSLGRLLRRNRASASRPERILPAADSQDEAPKADTDEGDSDAPDTRVLSKREKRARATAYQLTTMSANDRNALIHLSPAQQRSLLATQHKHAEKVQKEEKRRRAKVDRKGNKNLYAYWHTETPVYQCG